MNDQEYQLHREEPAHLRAAFSTENSYSALKRSITRDDLVSAYGAYRRGEPGALNHLIGLVREFAYSKLLYLDFSLQSGIHDADDFAQDVALDVWRSLGDHRGDAASFYAWVHKITFNHASDDFNALLKEKHTRVELQHEVTEDDEVFEEDNPAIYEEAAQINKKKWSERDSDGNLLWRYDEETAPGSETSQFDIGEIGYVIPDWVTGKDLVICDLIRQGQNYKQIARILKLTEGAVKQRMASIRRRAKQERAARREVSER